MKIARTFTPEPMPTDAPVEVETVKLANRNAVIKLPNGELCDPTFVSASNLARVPDAHFELVLA
jgi:hypothetical protein